MARACSAWCEHTSSSPTTLLLTNIFSRHPNYLGYTLWRTGASLATGSIPAAVISLLWQVNSFAGSIPDLTQYMANS